MQNNTDHIEYLVVGHVTRDKVEGGLKPGGTVTYSGQVARALGYRTGVLTSAREDYDLRQVMEGLVVRKIPAAEDAVFSNIYDGNNRIQILHNRANDIMAADVPEAWMTADIVHLGPLTNEVDPNMIDLFPNSLIGLTPQGWMRRWGDDGRLYHLGRMDHQVKIRGFRVETAEIESVLAEHPLVDQAIVVAHTVGPEDVRLVAYLIYQGANQRMIGDIRRYLRKRLPSYMVPAVVAQLDQVPLTPSGKIDRNQLPNPFENAVRTTTAFKEPKSGHEPVIAGIWRELLKVEKISADDNFFELGGHSLLALRFIVDLERKTGIRIDVRNVFFKTLHEIAAGVPA